jgi:hypothetical protein
MKVDWILGIDQVGATVGRRPKRLPYALLVNQGGVWILRKPPKLCAQGLAHLNKEALDLLIPDWKLKKGVIAVDAVLGLARECSVSQTKLKVRFKEARQKYSYGKSSGEKHFASYCSELSSTNFPRRLCEMRAKANSVFVTIPAQKNIQTGTHRIWLDLGEDTSWFELWPSGRDSAAVVVAEVYPSFLWKNIFGFSQREPEMVSKVFKHAQVRVANALLKIYREPNWADSAVAALGAKQILESGPKELWLAPKNNRCAKYEGWMLGLKTSADRKR